MLFELQLRLKNWTNLILERFGLYYRVDFRNLQDGFDLEQARQYWKFAPSGYGKVDTAKLLKMNDKKFARFWDRHSESIRRYYWEDRYFNDYFFETFRDKTVLSFGSGIGNFEIQFLQHGAAVTCADIVPTNLDVIQRICRIKQLDKLSVLYLDDSAKTDYGGPYDAIYARGSLHHMPFPMQKKVMARFKRALKPDGVIYLMLYSPKFMEESEGRNKPERFARASDPSVGPWHNPWSEWYDDEKIRELAGTDFFVKHKQTWNQDYYVWYSLQRLDDTKEIPIPIPLVDPTVMCSGENHS